MLLCDYTSKMFRLKIFIGFIIFCVNYSSSIVESKPGTCPQALGGGICVQGCTTDTSCPGREKCCSNGCGTACMLPITSVEEKPGACPSPSAIGGSICVHRCTTDARCPGRKKCCSNGCGTDCALPKTEGTCVYKGRSYWDGQTFMDDCNTCTCSSGNVACTSKTCHGDKPGKCPISTGDRYCIGNCNKDSSCTGNQKCCSTGCTHACMDPDFGDSCAHVSCPAVECPYGQRPYTPPGQCCKICRPRDSCAHVSCPAVVCPYGQRPYTPPGQCCKICRPSDSCAHISCPAVECPYGQRPYTPPGQCCKKCRPQSGQKPGSCPRRSREGPCGDTCTSDSSCPVQQKCCSNRCGRSCVLPIGSDRCEGISCPALKCRRQYRPPGLCCPVCRRRRRGRN